MTWEVVFREKKVVKKFADRGIYGTVQWKKVFQ